MWPFKRKENRAETAAVAVAPTMADLILAIMQSGGSTRDKAMQIPTISGSIDLIANIVAATPLGLYRDEGGKAVAITNDPRVFLLNDDTGDTLNANEFWRAMIRDYYLGKGGYAYIDRSDFGEFRSIHYIDESNISILKNTDPIFKDFNIAVNGVSYYPHNFLKILRNTKDGAEGMPITKENSQLIESMYLTLVLESHMAARGGNKRGFLQAEKRLEQGQINDLRTKFQSMYSNADKEPFVVLNQGLSFKEISDTAVEMQLNENKETNAVELAKLFHVSPESLSGKSGADVVEGLAKMAAIPLMTVIQCALNRDMLRESEKHAEHPLYWAFDTKELLKGDMKTRFDAYKVALESNFMQIDEVRYQEDLAPLGLSWIRLGLQDVLYDPKTKRIYTPNTGQVSVMGEQTLNPPQEPPTKQKEEPDV